MTQGCNKFVKLARSACFIQYPPGLLIQHRIQKLIYRVYRDQMASRSTCTESTLFAERKNLGSVVYSL